MAIMQNVLDCCGVCCKGMTGLEGLFYENFYLKNCTTTHTSPISRNLIALDSVNDAL